jgi:hypothetical protein
MAKRILLLLLTVFIFRANLHQAMLTSYVHEKGGNKLFGFESREDREKKMQEYQQKILPLGIGQKDAALSALRPVVNKKIIDTEILYAFFVSKEKYLDSGQNMSKPEAFLNKMKSFSADEKKYILKLILLDIETKSLEGYPTAEDILKK